MTVYALMNFNNIDPEGHLVGLYATRENAEDWRKLFATSPWYCGRTIIREMEVDDVAPDFAYLNVKVNLNTKKAVLSCNCFPQQDEYDAATNCFYFSTDFNFDFFEDKEALANLVKQRYGAWCIKKGVRPNEGSN